MRLTSFLICIAINLSLFANKPNVKATFFDGDFESAKLKAGQEGKLFFVDFYASWCTPCQWMDETAFTDTEVVKLLDSNYVALKVDIDQIEGYSIKEKYNIKMLPSLLIFNSEGHLIARIEETLSPRKLAQLLKFHNKSENKVRVKQKLNTSPKSSLEVDVEKEEKNSVLSKVTDLPVEAKPIYRVQIGVYSDYRKTHAIVKELRVYFPDNVVVQNDHKDNKAIYRIFMGAFDNKEDAKTYAAMLKAEYGIPGYVK